VILEEIPIDDRISSERIPKKVANGVDGSLGFSSALLRGFLLLPLLFFVTATLFQLLPLRCPFCCLELGFPNDDLAIVDLDDPLPV